MTEITLETLPSLPMSELAALSAAELMHLAKQVDNNLKQAKRAKGWVDNALKLKYEEEALRLRQLNGRTSGTLHFVDENVKVTAVLPKKVVWNQEKLKQLVQQIEDNGDDAQEYINIVYGVSEQHYNAWPEAIRRFFNPARTFTVGKQTFTLQHTEETLA